MKTRECELCDINIKKDDGVSFGVYDLCENCTKIVRRAICRECQGTGRLYTGETVGSTALWNECMSCA